jgi:uncharacterized protein with ParB-like and HNH nuclease domain
MSEQFKINAKTSTLKDIIPKWDSVNSKVNNYIIPIYQRPYSWSEVQIKKFISDLFISFWGNDCSSNEEPMFIGTMQLTSKNENNEQSIIDGQQRLTTFLILFKVLKVKFTDCEVLNKINLKWLNTKVNNGTQQDYLEIVINYETFFNETTQNPYLKNAFLINELIEIQIKNKDEQIFSFDINKFINHILGNIYFVTIETNVGLTKTLKIFNTINTTGLDLNSSDVFKIRMFEYLKDKKGKDESIFDNISQLYRKIDESNNKLKYNASNIHEILGIYQYILIAKYNLPIILYSYGTDIFFERLFETIFNINQWEYFKKNINKVELSIEDIEKIIQVRYEWEINGYKTCEDVCTMNFIWLSRYNKYWVLTFVFLYSFKKDEDYRNKMLFFTKQLSKLYILYSIRFLKAINEIHNFTFLLIKKIINNSFEEVMLTLKNKIGKLENHKGIGDLEYILNGDITYNPKIKNIICRLSAMLEEDYKTTNEEKTKLICSSLFDTAIDIEHIQSYHDNKDENREDIWNEWQENINSIGNLMVLEQEINRSLSNNEYDKKINKYFKSNFTIVNKQPIHYSNWDLEKCLLRKQKEVNKILNYLFN